MNYKLKDEVKILAKSYVGAGEPEFRGKGSCIGQVGQVRSLRSDLWHPVGVWVDSRYAGQYSESELELIEPLETGVLELIKDNLVAVELERRGG